MVEVLCGILVLVEDKIQQTNDIHGFQFEIPIALPGLLAYGKSGVENAPVLEKLPVGVLHLNYEILAFVVFAIYVENVFAFPLRGAEGFVVEVCEVGNYLLALQNSVQETDKQVLVRL